MANQEMLATALAIGKALQGGGAPLTINGITYDDGSNIATAVKDLTRYARMERRV